MTGRHLPETALATRWKISPSSHVSSGEKPEPSIFNTTRWSVVLAAGEGKTVESEIALSWLCEQYWFPLYTYARHLGNPEHEAEDLVQGFFEQVLERNIFSDLTAERGRFRAFLLACFNHFIRTQHRNSQTKRRGGGLISVGLEEAAAETRYQHDFTAKDSAERDFDRAWALTVLDRVFSRLRVECEAEGKGGRFAVIQAFLQTEVANRSYEDAAAELGVTTTALRVMVFRMRQRFREMLVEEITQTVADPAEVAAEMRYLFTALGK